MLVKKSIITSLLAISVTSLPVLAQAGDLDVSNNTDEYSTTYILNPIGKVCSSTALGDDGITKPRQQNHIISEGKLNLACFADKTNCVAEVYMTNDCSGDKVATVTFDTSTGVKSISMSSNKYVISGSGFKLQMDYRK